MAASSKNPALGANMNRFNSMQMIHSSRSVCTHNDMRKILYFLNTIVTLFVTQCTLNSVCLNIFTWC